MPLEWTDEQPPNDECRYTHVSAETPIGRVLIEWKGWKEDDAFVCTLPIDADDVFVCAPSLREAKGAVERRLHRLACDLMQSTSGDPTPSPPPQADKS